MTTKSCMRLDTGPSVQVTQPELGCGKYVGKTLCRETDSNYMQGLVSQAALLNCRTLKLAEREEQQG